MLLKNSSVLCEAREMELQAELVAGEQKLEEVLQEREARRRCANTCHLIYIILYYIVLYYDIILYYIILYYTILYHIILYIYSYGILDVGRLQVETLRRKERLQDLLIKEQEASAPFRDLERREAIEAKQVDIKALSLLAQESEERPNNIIYDISSRGIRRLRQMIQMIRARCRPHGQYDVQKGSLKAETLQELACAVIAL